MRRRLRDRLKRYSKKTWLFVGLGVVAACLLGGGAYAALGGIGQPQSSSDIELQRGLIGWWKLDGNAKDSTPYGNNGTITGTTAWPDHEGRAGGAMHWAGSPDRVLIPDAPILNPTNEVSVGAWFYANNVNSGVQRIVSKFASGGYSLYLTGTGTVDGCGDNNLCAKVRVNGVGDTYASVASSSLNNNNWYYLAMTYDGSNVKLYINNALVATSPTAAGTITNGAVSLCFGTNNDTCGSNFLDTAAIDDVRIYNRALRLNEVQALYRSYDTSLQAASGENGLLGWWKLDGNTKDSTPYAANLTLSGSTVPTLTTDRKAVANSAYGFDGVPTTGGYLLGPTNNMYDTTVNVSRTYSIWFKSPSNPSVSQSFFYKSSNCIGWNMQINTNGTVSFNTTMGTSCSDDVAANLSSPGGGPYYADNKWHLATYVVDRSGTTVTGYIDGNQVTTGSIDNTTTGQNFGTLRIGADWNDSHPFTGSLDDARIYNRALTQAEIMNLYNTYNSQINLNSSPSSTAGGGNINAGLVGYWPFNGNAKDATPNSNNGTVSGATLTPDRFGRANSAYLVGNSSQWINVGNPSTYSNLTTTGFTYSIWLMRTGASTYQWPEIMGSSNTHQYYGIRSVNYGDSITFEFGTSPFTGSSFNSLGGYSLPVGQWYMFTFTYDGTTLRAYKNGVAGLNAAVPLNPTFGGLSFTTSSNGWQGSIDDARLYNRALSATEVQALYNSQN